MAFRRFRGKSRFPRRRTFRRRSRGGSFARKQYDRIVLFNNYNLGQLTPQPSGCSGVNGNTIFGCPPLEVGSCSRKSTPDPECGLGTTCGTCGETAVECSCCSNQINFTLVNNSTLQSYFQDSVTIVRMYGDIRYRALVASPFNAEYCTLTGPQLRQFNSVYRTSYAESWNWAVRKHERSQADAPEGQLSPFDAASPAYDYDWTESSPPWIWQRSHMWFPRNTRSFMSRSYDSIAGICSDTSGGATNIVPAAASGSQPSYIIDTNVSTTCGAMTAAEVGLCGENFTGETVTEPPWHQRRIRIRKHIKMVRDQDLNLICTVRHPQITLAGGWPCIPAAAFPGFEARGGDVTYQFYIRIAAVVQLN